MSETSTEESVVDEVRRIRKELWTKFDNDPKKFFAGLHEFCDELRAEGYQFWDPRKDRN
jgi:hypothetical protein